MYRYFELSVKGLVGIIKMDRSPANAFSMDFIKEFNNAFDEFAENKGVRVIIIMSKLPKIFAAGADINDMLTQDTPAHHSALKELFNKIQNLPKPVIAMINGHALGGGFEMTLCCDFRFMDKDGARIGLPEINLGILPASGGTQRMSRLIGRAKATELLLEGKRIGAEEALDIGLIHRAYNREELMPKTLEYAHKLAKQAPVAVRAIKRCLNEGLDLKLAQGLDLERESLLALLETEDVKEGVRAFLGKRSPEFKGI
ncbi:enoyl-CoA hydratase/isomerase family protein [Thermodesulfobacteriota bacterium]